MSRSAPRSRRRLPGLLPTAIVVGALLGAVGAAAPPVVTDARAGPPPAVTAPCGATARACVQLSTQHGWLLVDGRVVRDGFVSTGATGTETPTGTFAVQYKDATHHSAQYDTPMPYSVFFDTRGDALHEGSPAVPSRGCVHLEHDDAVAFFAALEPGDEVQILP